MALLSYPIFANNGDTIDLTALYPEDSDFAFTSNFTAPFPG